jgi:uncharacterized protein (DUF983 family)
MKEFVEPWHTCPSCHQCYQNELAIDIATEFVSFIQGKIHVAILKVAG